VDVGVRGRSPVIFNPISPVVWFVRNDITRSVVVLVISRNQFGGEGIFSPEDGPHPVFSEGGHEEFFPLSVVGHHDPPAVISAEVLHVVPFWWSFPTGIPTPVQVSPNDILDVVWAHILPSGLRVGPGAERRVRAGVWGWVGVD